MFINIDYKSIDMQDVADPIKSLEHFYTFKPLATIDRRLRVEYELASNDFIDQRDLLGIMDQEPEPYKFLQIDNKFESERYHKEQINIVQRDYSVELTFKLTEKKYTFERNFYNFITMASDIGGFTDFVIIIPTFIMAYYSKKMYMSQIYTEIPVKQSQKLRHKNRIQEKFTEEMYSERKLSQCDIECLIGETNRMYLDKPNFIQNLIKSLCLSK